MRSDSAQNTIEQEILCSVERSMAMAFIEQQSRSNALIRLYSLIASKPESVSLAYEAMSSYLGLCTRILIATSTLVHTTVEQDVIEDSGNALSNVQQFHDAMAGVLELSNSHVVPHILKIHPECLPTNFHQDLIDTLTCAVDALSVSSLSSCRALLPMDMTQSSTETNELVVHDEKPYAVTYGSPNDLTTPVAYKLGLLKDFVRSRIMALRITGIDILSAYLVYLWKQYTYDHRTQEVHPLLQFTADLLRSKGFIKYLFGSDSHADLIRRSAKVVEFLFVTKRLTCVDAEILWMTCLQNQYSDFGQASFQVMCSLLRGAEYREKMFFCRKYRDLLPSQMGKSMILLYKEIQMNLKSKAPGPEVCLDAACISVGILQKVSSERKSFSIQQVREIIMAGVIELLDPSEACHDSCLTLLRLCSRDIKGRTSSATGSVYSFLDLSTKWPSTIPTAIAAGIISFREVVDELCEFMHDSREESYDLHSSFANALHSRIQLADIVLACAPETCDKETEIKFWNHTIGPAAMGNAAREFAWQGQAADPMAIRSLSGHLSRCVTLYLPFLPAAFATPGMLSVYRHTLTTDTFDQSTKSQFREEILRFALTTPRDDVADCFMTTIMETVYYDQSPDCRQTTELQIAIVTRCIECVSTRMEDEISRAIKLLRRILKHSLDRYRTQGALKTDLTPIGGPGESKNSFQLVVQVLHAQNPMVKQSITVREDDTLADLQCALMTAAYSRDYVLISGGQLVDLTQSPARSIREVGLAGKVLILKTRNTLQSIQQDRLSKKGRTVLERVVLENFQSLFDYLDHADEATEQERTLQSSTSSVFDDVRYQVFQLLNELEYNTIWDADLLDGSLWKVMYSVHCLSVELNEQIALGVADGDFVLRGIRTLTQALDTYGKTTQWMLLQSITSTLFLFLQGSTSHLTTCTLADQITRASYTRSQRSVFRGPHSVRSFSPF